MKQNILLLILAVCASSATVNAQQLEQNTVRKIKQDKQPKGLDNHSFGVFYYNGKNVYNVRGYQICTGDSIDDLKINPSYTSFATLEHNKKGVKHVSVYDAGKQDELIKKIKLKDINTTAIAYSYDAKQFAVASADKQITIYNPQNFQIIKTYTAAIWKYGIWSAAPFVLPSSSTVLPTTICLATTAVCWPFP